MSDQGAAAAAAAKPERQLGLLRLSLLAVAVGLITGLGAIVFRGLIAGVHNLFFYGRLSLEYDSEMMFEPSVWGWGVVLVPVIGGMGVVWIVRTFAPEARGHGVPEVMDAIYHRNGAIRPVVAVAKSLASALSIGSGAAVGREGPIIQIGAALGSSMGGVLRIASWQRITMIAAGAGAGIAATFNTPLGGVMFAVELMLPELSSRTFLPVVLATATATYVGRLAFGMVPAFLVPGPDVLEVEILDPYAFVTMSALGILCGVAAWGFIRLLTFMEEVFERMPLNPYAAHALGMLGVGGLMLAFFELYGHYYIAGASYGTISSVLHGGITGLSLLALLFAAKLAATTVSLASGASGGIFSPSLFLGATLGAAFGVVMGAIHPAGGVSPMEFAVVGMAAMVGGGTGAAMTAIVMVFEMTRDYAIIVPMVIAVALAIGVRRALSLENIYTIKLAWRGKRIPQERHLNMFLVRHAAQCMETRVQAVPRSLSVSEALERLTETEGARYALAMDAGGRVRAVLSCEALMRAEREGDGDAGLESFEGGFAHVGENEILSDAMSRMSGAGPDPEAELAVVLREGTEAPLAENVLGVLDKAHLADSVMAHFRALGPASPPPRPLRRRGRG